MMLTMKLPSASVISYIICLLLLSAESGSGQEVLTPEELFKIALRRWQRKDAKDYQPWLDFATKIYQRFDQELRVEEEGTKEPPPRLNVVGAMEESILDIEKATISEGENPARDSALSRLYESYGHALMELTPFECHALALDPHTLLIGAESVKSNPSQTMTSSHLCVENAENSLRNAVTLDATNQDAQSLLGKVLGTEADAVHARKPKEFVAELFDSFADTFDEKLLKGLSYKVPQLVGESVHWLTRRYNNKQPFQNALDAGCGTGLAGRFLRPHVSQKLIGVDASQKMLDIAGNCTLAAGCGIELLGEAAAAGVQEESSNKALYDGLLNLDLESMTVSNTLYHKGDNDAREGSSNDDGFDLIVAADVLVYFGSLDTIMHTFAEIGAPGGFLVFSCERADDQEAPLGWRLLPSGRFAHTKAHVVAMTRKAGYRMVKYEEIVPRMEKGKEVQGHLFALRHDDRLAKRHKKEEL